MSYFIKSQHCLNTGMVFNATTKHSQTDNVNTILLASHLKGTENHLPNCADVIRHVQLSVARQEMMELFFSTLGIHGINTETQLFMALYSFEEEKQTSKHFSGWHTSFTELYLFNFHRNAEYKRQVSTLSVCRLQLHCL